MRISELAAALGTRADNLKEDTKITGITTLEAARTGQVSFISSEKYAARAKGTGASAVIVPEGMQLEGIATLPMKEPWAGVLFLLNRFHPCDRHVYFRGTHASAVIDPAAKLGADVTVGPGAVIAPGVQVGARTVIGPNCVIGSDTTIGEDCIIHASVTVTHGIVIGNRVIVHPGSVIGADGFKYEVLGGRWTKIPQVGRVVIEDDAEIGANVCIDRASFTETRVGRNSKIDNLVQIAHNVDIGSDCVVVSQVGIAGSTTVGDGSILAAQCGIADNLRLGSRVRVLARAGVKDHLKDGETVVGAPARPFRTAAKIMAAETKLPEMVAELHALKKRIEELEKKLAQG